MQNFQRMASIMRDILGDDLYMPDQLDSIMPSPRSLSGKILIKVNWPFLYASDLTFIYFSCRLIVLFPPTWQGKKLPPGIGDEAGEISEDDEALESMLYLWELPWSLVPMHFAGCPANRPLYSFFKILFISVEPDADTESLRSPSVRSKSASVRSKSTSHRSHGSKV